MKRIILTLVIGLIVSLASVVKAEQVGSWSLTEGSGNIAGDIAQYPRNSNGILNGPDWVAGKYSSGLHFNGKENVFVRIKAGEALSKFRRQITIMAWVKCNSLDGPKGIFTKGGIILKKSDHDNRFMLQLPGLSGGMPNGAFFNATPATSGEWIHIAVTYDGTAVQFYYNGQLDGTTPASGLINNSRDDLYIGQNFDGILNEVRLFSHAETEKDVQKEMKIFSIHEDMGGY